MQLQPWITDDNWASADPKLLQAASQPAKLRHTSDLASSIALDPPGILLVRGPRQVGKSTFLRQFAQRCLMEGIPPRALALFDAERCSDRHQLFAELESFVKAGIGRIVVLVDELSSIDGWWLAIKALADGGMLTNALVLGTGSSAIDLSMGADFLPGRRGARYPVDLELLPVPYRMVEELLSIEQYMLTGGMPWAINEYLRLGVIPAYVYDLHAAWLKGALQKRRHSAMRLPYLLRELATRMCSPVSVLSLTRDCGIGSNNTTETYLDILELAYALVPAYWCGPEGGAPAPRKNRKFYPADPFLFHLFADFDRGWEGAFASAKERLDDPTHQGRVVECIVAAELRRRTGKPRLGYWLGTREIDFVGEELFEVKYRNHVGIDEFAWTQKVLNPAQRLTVITKQDAADDGKTRLVPLRQWLTQYVSARTSSAAHSAIL